VDFTTGEIVNQAKGARYSAKPIPDFMREIIKADGLVAYIKKSRT
jgi:3-isopropylmalate/(R)-2-methylmalate dehydratase small subunit